MAPSKEEQYTLLNGEDDHEVGRSARREEEDPQCGQAARGLSRGVIAALVIFVAIDIFAYLYIAKALVWLPIPKAPEELEFRNAYFGLDDLYRLGKAKTSKYPRILNMPRWATQIDKNRPDWIPEIDPHRWLSDFGLLSPPDRHLQVSESIHTVLHFSTIDYGMEKCSLAVRLPKRDEPDPWSHSFKDIDGEITLDVCQLSIDKPLEQTAVTWAKRPKCNRRKHTIGARIGEEVEFTTFPCKTASFLTFEVSCNEKNPNCGVDVWSNQNSTWGMYLYQYQTL